MLSTQHRQPGPINIQRCTHARSVTLFWLVTASHSAMRWQPSIFYKYTPHLCVSTYSSQPLLRAAILVMLLRVGGVIISPRVLHLPVSIHHGISILKSGLLWTRPSSRMRDICHGSLRWLLAMCVVHARCIVAPAGVRLCCTVMKMWSVFEQVRLRERLPGWGLFLACMPHLRTHPQ